MSTEQDDGRVSVGEYRLRIEVMVPKIGEDDGLAPQSDSARAELVPLTVVRGYYTTSEEAERAFEKVAELKEDGETVYLERRRGPGMPSEWDQLNCS